MAKIVLVHGIAQEQLSADLLEAEWIPALIGGVRNAGYPAIADALKNSPGEIRMAFYGKLFLVEGRQGAALQLQDLNLTGSDAEIPDQIAFEWLQRAAQYDANAQASLNLLTDQTGTEQQGRLRNAGMRAAVLASRSKWFSKVGMAFAQRFVERSLAQVSIYLTDSRIRQAAQEMILNLIEPDTQVVIGHSLGSVVAFEVLHRVPQKIPLFVTIGSPLGLGNIITRKLIPQPPMFPPCVQRWVNVAAHDDLVAAEPNLTNLFPGIPHSAVFEGLFTVDNGSSPHSGLFYLGKENVGRPIGDVMTRLQHQNTVGSAQQ